MTRFSRAQPAFTLIEILLAIAVIAVLLALLFPALASARRAGKRAGCLANLHAFGQALELYRGANKDLLPWADNFADLRLDLVAPFDTLAQKMDVAFPTISANNFGGRVSTGQPFLCPADKRWGPLTGFSYSYLPFGFMQARLESRERVQREVSALFARSTQTPVMLDATHAHRDGPPPPPGVPDFRGKNFLLLDGSANAAPEIMPNLIGP